jgi:hypothetical protein
MFDHVKHVQEWTTMACHVYDSMYCKVLTIAIKIHRSLVCHVDKIEPSDV